MRIADFVLANLDPILKEWEIFARSLVPDGSLTSAELRDHAEIMLLGIAKDLRAQQTSAEEIRKSHGNEPRTVQTEAGEEHGLERHQSDFTVEQLVAEYRALRSSVLRLWTDDTPQPNATEIGDIVRFNEAIDQLLAASVVSFAEASRKDLAAEAGRREQFLAMLAHELRNPLAPISSAAALLNMTKSDDPTVARASTVIYRQASHMASIVDDLLDVSRVTRGAITLKVKPLDLRHVIADAVEQVLPKIQAKGHRFELTPLPKPIMLEADRKRLVQVCANLLTNAAKYTPDGGSIRLTVDEWDEEICIAVEDDGVGVAADFLPHVFELFAQAEQTPDRSSGGLGMGLALVKSLVELHKGKVSCSSEGAGSGSRFVVRLPRPLEEIAQGERRRAGRTPAPAGNPLKILLVDDNVDAADTLAMLLEAGGHQVLTAHCAMDGLDLARRNAPDLLLLDLGLPDIDGNELARRLRTHPTTRTAVLVALTGYGQPEDRQRTAAAGFDHHLVKPVDIQRLYQLIASVPANAAAPAADE